MEDILKYVMETPGNTNPAILGQMLDEASGTKLPEPTAQDNGKVLGVSDGSYALVNGGGGGTSYTDIVVHFKATVSYNEETELPTYTVIDCDYTYDELLEAMDANKTAIGVLSIGDGDASEFYANQVIPLSLDNNYNFTGSLINAIDDGEVVQLITFYIFSQSNEWGIESHNYNLNYTANVGE